MDWQHSEKLIGAVWTAIGPLIGVLVGAVLTRSWDRRKWINDCRKQEFRELIDAISDAATALMARRIHLETHTITQEMMDEGTAKNNQALRIMKSRLFISRDMVELDLFERWGQGIKGLAHGGELTTFDEIVDKILADIVRAATK